MAPSDEKVPNPCIRAFNLSPLYIPMPKPPIYMHQDVPQAKFFIKSLQGTFKDFS